MVIDNLLSVHGGFELEDGDLFLHIINYLSKVHLQNDIICFEVNRKILYSSDLMQSKDISEIINGDWNRQVAIIDYKRVPNQIILNNLKESLW